MQKYIVFIFLLVAITETRSVSIEVFPTEQKETSVPYPTGELFDDFDALCNREEPTPSSFRVPLPHAVEVFFRKIGVKIFMRYVALRTWFISCKKAWLK